MFVTSARQFLRAHRRRVISAALTLTAVATATGLVAGSLSLRANADGDGCARAVRHLTVLVTPEIAPAVNVAAGSLARSTDSCLTITVTVQSSADAATAPAGGTGPPQVWIPDSSIWTERTVDGQDAPSVALSPVVLAVSNRLAGQYGWPARPVSVADLTEAAAADSAGDHPVRLGLPDPKRSATAVGAVLAIEGVLQGRSDERSALASAVRSGPAALPADTAKLLGELTTDSPLAVPVSEQSVSAYNATAGAVKAVAAYPAAGRMALDYPFVVLAPAEQDRLAAARLLRELRDGDGAQQLRKDGFRPAADAKPAALPSVAGVDRQLPAGRDVPTATKVDWVVRTVQQINLRSRLLAVIDVSGSMGEKVPGGRTRMELTQEAAALGLAAYPDDSDVGLWSFSTDLTATGDYRQLVSIGPLGPRSDGRTGRAQLAHALAGLHYKPNGGTGLYDTALAAVRKVRTSWKADRLNAVLLLTDGRNDDSGIPLPQLLATLRAEADPDRPVPVITIAYGPGSDAAALKAISSATGGTRYLARDPGDIQKVLFDAIGRRPCNPAC